MSTRRLDLIKEIRNCSSLCPSSSFFVILFNPFSKIVGSGDTAPISCVRFLHLIHLRNAAGASAMLCISLGSSRLRRRVCFSCTPPGQYVSRRCVSIPNTDNRLAETSSSLTPSGNAWSIIVDTLRSNLCHLSSCSIFGGSGRC